MGDRSQHPEAPNNTPSSDTATKGADAIRAFFESYPDFIYNPHERAEVQFSRLAIDMCWMAGWHHFNEALARFSGAILQDRIAYGDVMGRFESTPDINSNKEENWKQQQPKTGERQSNALDLAAGVAPLSFLPRQAEFNRSASGFRTYYLTDMETRMEDDSSFTLRKSSEDRSREMLREEQETLREAKNKEMKEAKKAGERGKRKCKKVGSKKQDHLEAFFSRYLEYNSVRDRNESVATQMDHLRRYGLWWEERAPLWDIALEGYKEALVLQFNEWYGTDVKDLGTWHRILEAIGIEPPETISECEWLMNLLHVNIVDLVDATLHPPGSRMKIQIFHSEKALAKYTVESHKYFPNAHVKAGGVLKYLLREILHSDGETGPISGSWDR